MIDSVTWWFEKTQYKNKIEIMIMKLVETMWLTRHPWPAEITNDQGSKFIGHGFIRGKICADQIGT